MKRLISVVLAVFLLAPFAQAEGPEDRLNDYIRYLESYKPTTDPAQIELQGQRMDNDWSYFAENLSQYQPLFRKKILEEAQKKNPRPLVLIALLGFYVNGDPDDLSSSKIMEAYFKIDPDHTDTLHNWSSYFSLSIGMGASGDSRLLDHFDRVFHRKVFMKPSPLPIPSFDPAIQTMHVYGALGLKAVPHLLAMLKSAKTEAEKEEIMLNLRNLCTIDCADPVYKFVENGSSDSLLKHATYILLDLGGAKGRDLFLALKPKKFAAHMAPFFVAERKYAKKLNLNFYKKRFGKVQHPKIKAGELKQILRKSYYQITEVSNSDILNSKVPTKELLALLYKMRAGLFVAVNQHCIEALRDLNSLINALYFRG